VISREWVSDCACAAPQTVSPAWNEEEAQLYRPLSASVADRGRITAVFSHRRDGEPRRTVCCSCVFAVSVSIQSLHGGWWEERAAEDEPQTLGRSNTRTRGNTAHFKRFNVWICWLLHCISFQRWTWMFIKGEMWVSVASCRYEASCAIRPHENKDTVPLVMNQFTFFMTDFVNQMCVMQLITLLVQICSWAV